MVAVTWCSACHRVGPGARRRRKRRRAHRLRSIPQRLPSDADVLAAFIADPLSADAEFGPEPAGHPRCPFLYRNLEMTWLASWRGWAVGGVTAFVECIIGVRGEPTTQDKSVTERGSTCPKLSTNAMRTSPMSQTSACGMLRPIWRRRPHSARSTIQGASTPLVEAAEDEGAAFRTRPSAHSARSIPDAAAAWQDRGKRYMEMAGADAKQAKAAVMPRRSAGRRPGADRHWSM